MEHLTTSKLAKQGGVNIETIRYYERRGLLPKAPRTPSGYRSFTEDSVRRLRFVRRAQALGFSLHEIRELLALRKATRGTSCGNVRTRAEMKLKEIDAKMRSLRAMRRALKQFTAVCPGDGPVSDCPILDALNGEM
jgi:Hg(II)-responsive transcriptional regulator